MKLALWKRTALAGMLMMGVAGAALTAAAPAHALECPDGYVKIRTHGGAGQKCVKLP